MNQKSELDTPRCLECKEGIFNPICITCLNLEVGYFLYEIDEKLFSLFDNDFSSFFKPADSLIKQQCAVCFKRSRKTYCPYCYTEKVYEWLSKVKPSLVKPFLRIFNFDFDKTGYAKELDY